MKTMWIVGGLALGAIGMAVGGLRPVPQPTEDNTITVTAEVQGIRATDSYDIFFLLKDVDGVNYYINRGVEQGLDPEALRAYLVGKEVSLTYVDHKSLLDPGGRARHLVAVSCGDSLIFAQ